MIKPANLEALNRMYMHYQRAVEAKADTIIPEEVEFWERVRSQIGAVLRKHRIDVPE